MPPFWSFWFNSNKVITFWHYSSFSPFNTAVL